MRAQGFGRVEITRKLGFGQAGVYFPVADMVHQNGRSTLAAFQFGDQVMQALWYVRRDRPQAKGADRVINLNVARACQGLDPETGLRHESGTNAPQGKGCPWISI